MAKRSEIYGNDGIRDDKSQVFLYRHPDFAVYAQRNVYPKTYPFTVTDHWHDEVEFIYVYSGSLNYYVEGNCITLHGGQGLFINSRKVHVGKPNSNEAVDYYFAIIHPMLLCASKYVDETFVEPIIQNPALPYIIFDEANSDWEKEILKDVASISDAHSREEGELEVQMTFFKIWKNMYSHIDLKKKTEIPQNHNLATLKDMISYIYLHYKEKVELKDIAKAGSIGKTMCTSIFNKYVNKTPGEFLRDYRIQQSVVLLKTTDMSVTDICYETGFSDASYYSKTFKDVMGTTPLQYRKENSEVPLSHFSKMLLNQDSQA